MSTDLSNEIIDLSTKLSNDLFSVSSFISSEVVSLSTRLSNDLCETSSYLSSAIRSKIWIEDHIDTGTLCGPSDLSVIKIGIDEFNERVALKPDKMPANVLYVVQSDYIEAYGQVLSNLSTTGVEGVSEAANTGYVKDFAAATVKSLSVDDIVLSSPTSDVLSVITTIEEKDGKIQVKATELSIENVCDLCAQLSFLDKKIHDKIFISSDSSSGYSNLSVVSIGKDEYE